jgi:putative N6-adenine-specific DNA methylase
VTVSPGRRLEAFVVVAPGLETLAHDEVTRLGIRPARRTHGGIECEVTLAQLWALHLHSRLATRVLVRANRFRADGFDTLRNGIRRVDWAAWLAPGTAVRVDATCDRDSKLFHSDAVAARVAEAIGRPAGEGATVLVRVRRDVVTVSVDATGVSLHQRGYRQDVAKAPLRETLAAAVVVGSSWDRRAPFVDPFCGSGTLAIEAAMLALRVPPGLQRSFACWDWPSFDRERWDRQADAARADILERELVVVASDRDDGAVAATLANAARAGVTVQAERRAISDLALPVKRGWIVTNPPYGQRTGDPATVRDLYDRTGAVLRDRASGWQLSVLAPPQPPLVGRLGIDLAETLRTSNGGIPVVLNSGSVP